MHLLSSTRLEYDRVNRFGRREICFVADSPVSVVEPVVKRRVKQTKLSLFKG